MGSSHGIGNGDPLDASALASIVRHDLVNPLSALHGWLHLLTVRPSPADEVVQRALDGAHRALDQQQRQIEQLAALIELSAPGAAPAAESSRVSELLRALAQRMPGWLISESPSSTAGGDSTTTVVGPAALLGCLLCALGEFVHRQGQPGATCWLDVSDVFAGVSFSFQVAPVREPAQFWPGLVRAQGGEAESIQATVASLFAGRLMAMLGGRVEPLPPNSRATGLVLWLPTPPTGR